MIFEPNRTRRDASSDCKIPWPFTSAYTPRLLLLETGWLLLVSFDFVAGESFPTNINTQTDIGGDLFLVTGVVAGRKYKYLLVEEEEGVKAVLGLCLWWWVAGNYTMNYNHNRRRRWSF